MCQSDGADLSEVNRFEHASMIENNGNRGYVQIEWRDVLKKSHLSNNSVHLFVVIYNTSQYTKYN